VIDDIHILLLGPVQVQQQGKRIDNISTNKVSALLGYLASQDQPCSRKHLTDIFWPNHTDKQGRANLSWSLSKINSLLPNCFQNDPHSVRFREDAPLWLDTVAFEAWVKRGDLQALASAVELYRDEFMRGTYLDDCPLFESWLVQEQERWRQQVSQVLHQLLHEHTARGEYDRALKFGARLLELNPWQEKAHRQMMRALAFSGQRSQALAQYKACYQVLAQELDVEPSEQTQALYERIQAMGAVIPHNLPTPATPFVGRQEERATVAAQMDANRLLTLVGHGGVGKTRLALEVARVARNRFLDGVFFVSLAALSSSDFIVNAIVEALGLEQPVRRTPTEHLLDHLRAKELLLVLDNFEHLLEGVDVLKAILTQASHVTLLVTSRSPLGLEQAWQFMLSPLDVPPSEEVAVEEFSAVQLFLETLRRTSLGWTEKDLPAIARICRLAEGLPLAVELAASWVEMHTCHDIAVELEHNLLALTSPKRDVLDRHRSLEAVFNHSWTLLSQREQRLFAVLSVFRGDFSSEVARFVLDTEQQDKTAATRTLTGLVNHALLLKEEQTPPRYRLLEPVRQFATKKLERAGESRLAHERHLTFFLRLAERAEPELKGPDQRTWLDRLEVEQDNLRAALSWALQAGHPEEGLRMAGALGRFWEFHAHFSEGRKWLEQALAATENTPTSARAKACLCAGMLSKAQADFQRALELIEESRACYETLNDPSGVATTLHNLGALAFDQNEYDRARLYYLDCLAMLKKSGDKQHVAGTLNNLGEVAHTQGDYAGAQALYERALKLNHELGNLNFEASNLNNLGIVAQKQGDYTQAQSFYEQSLELLHKLGMRHAAAVLTFNLGEVAQLNEDGTKAQTFYERALTIFRELDMHSETAVALTQLGDVAHANGDDTLAHAFYEESLQVNREIKDNRGIPMSLIRLAGVALVKGHPKRAAQLLGSARALLEKIGAVLDGIDLFHYDQHEAALHEALGEKIFVAAWDVGKTMPLEQICDQALLSDL